MFSIKRAQKEAERNYWTKYGFSVRELEAEIDKVIGNAVKNGERTITYYIPEKYSYNVIMDIEQLYRKEGYSVLIEHGIQYMITIGW